MFPTISSATRRGKIPSRWLNFLSDRKVLHPRSQRMAEGNSLERRDSQPHLFYLHHRMLGKDRFFQKNTVFRLKNHEKFILQTPENRIQLCRLSQVYVVYGIFNTRGKKDAIIVLTMKRSAAFAVQDIDSEIYALKMRSMVSLNKKGEHTNENDG